MKTKDDELPIVPSRTFNFKENKVEEMTLDELKLTYHERYTTETTLNGIHHVDFIMGVASVLTKNNMDFNVETIFAADNKVQGNPGVILVTELEKQYGAKAIQAHSLKRVFTTIRINNGEDAESNTGLAIAYHQDGIQLALGANIKICHNQTILNAERMVQTYGGDAKIKSIDRLMEIVDDWMKNFGEQRTRDKKIIAKMKQIPCSYEQTMNLIGRLNTLRVVKDTSNRELKAMEKNLGKNYPLNQTQISLFVENYLVQCIARKSTDMTLWEIYNIATDLYKPSRTDFPNILPQNVAWSEFLVNEFNL